MSNSKFKKIKKRSRIPVFLIAGLWILYGLIFPLYKLSHIVICILLSTTLYIIGNIIFPASVFDIPIEPPIEKTKREYEPDTGDPETDKLIKEGFAKISHLKDINNRIQDPVLTIKINHMESLAVSIFDAVITKPQKVSSIRRFMNYYLPTSLKLLETYDKLSKSGAKGENVTSTLRSVENSMDMIVHAFEKQLDNLYADVAIDISTDIEVLETVLENEGLKETSFN